MPSARPPTPKPGAPRARPHGKGRSPALRPYRALVAIACGVAAFACWLQLAWWVHFQYHSDTGIVGWVSVHRYPKQQETFYFLLATVGTALVVWSAIALWMLGSEAVARASGRPAAAVLRRHAVLSLGLLAPLPRLARLAEDPWKPLAAGAAAATGAALLLLLVDRRRRHDPALAAERAVAAAPAAPVPPRGGRAARIVAGALRYGVWPVLIYALHYRGVLDGWVDLFHEGEFLLPMGELLRGAVPYRDVYLQHGLFHNAWLPLLASALFGPTLAGVRTMLRLLAPLPYVAVYALGLAVFRGGAGTALLLSGFLLGKDIGLPERGVLALASLAAAASAIRADDGGTRAARRWLAAGALAGFAFWHSVEVGLYALAAETVFLLADAGLRGRAVVRWRGPLWSFGVGAAGALGLIGSYFVRHGAVYDVLRNVYVQCAYQEDTWGLAYPSLWKLWNEGDWWHALTGPAMLWYGPIFALAVAGGHLAYRSFDDDFRRSRRTAQLLFLVLAGMLFLRSMFGRSDWWHTHYGVVFMLVLALLLLEGLWAGAWGRLARRRDGAWAPDAWGAPWLAAAVAASAAIAVYVQTAYQPIAGLGERWGRAVDPPPRTTASAEPIARAGVVDVPGGELNELRQVVAYIRAHSRDGECVYDFANQPGYLFFADRCAASRYFQACYASPPALQEEVIGDLERRRPPLVLYTSKSGYSRHDGLPSWDRHPLIARYLATHYERADVIAGLEMWRRRD